MYFQANKRRLWISTTMKRGRYFNSSYDKEGSKRCSCACPSAPSSLVPTLRTRKEELQLQYSPTWQTFFFACANSWIGINHTFNIYLLKSFFFPNFGFFFFVLVALCSFITFCVFSNVLFLNIQAKEFSFLRFFFLFLLHSLRFRSLSLNSQLHRLLLHLVRLVCVLFLRYWFLPWRNFAFLNFSFANFFLI